MPVGLLLCEGGENSRDVRVLFKLLAGRCGRILPLGGKYGLGERIKARREIGVATVFGLLDGDFLEKWEAPTDEPREWLADGVRLGWRWARKEIENYLADPVVVARALGCDAPTADHYREALERARERTAVYEAARTALATSRRRWRDLPSAFGRQRGREKHPFPDALDEVSCRAAIGEQVGAHRQSQVVEEAQVQARLTALLPEFVAGGGRHRDYLHAFAGKDLLWAMDDDLRSLGWGGAAILRERVLVGLTQTADDIGGWLPEWRALQLAVESA